MARQAEFSVSGKIIKAELKKSRSKKNIWMVYH